MNVSNRPLLPTEQNLKRSIKFVKRELENLRLENQKLKSQGKDHDFSKPMAKNLGQIVLYNDLLKVLKNVKRKFFNGNKMNAATRNQAQQTSTTTVQNAKEKEVAETLVNMRNTSAKNQAQQTSTTIVQDAKEKEAAETLMNMKNKKQ